MLKIAIQMDPITNVDIHADTTFDFALEAFGRGYEVWTFGPSTLQLNGSDVLARAKGRKT